MKILEKDNLNKAIFLLLITSIRHLQKLIKKLEVFETMPSLLIKLSEGHNKKKDQKQALQPIIKSIEKLDSGYLIAYLKNLCLQIHRVFIQQEKELDNASALTYDLYAHLNHILKEFIIFEVFDVNLVIVIAQFSNKPLVQENLQSLLEILRQPYQQQIQQENMQQMRQIGRQIQMRWIQEMRPLQTQIQQQISNLAQHHDAQEMPLRTTKTQFFSTSLKKNSSQEEKSHPNEDNHAPGGSNDDLSNPSFSSINS